MQVMLYNPGHYYDTILNLKSHLDTLSDGLRYSCKEGHCYENDVILTLKYIPWNYLA